LVHKYCFNTPVSAREAAELIRDKVIAKLKKKMGLNCEFNDACSEILGKDHIYWEHF